MHYTVQHCDLKALKCDCLLLGIFENKLMPASTQQIDALTRGTITTLLNQGDITGKLGECLMLYPLSTNEPPNQALPNRVLLVGAGKETDINDQVYYKII